MKILWGGTSYLVYLNVPGRGLRHFVPSSSVEMSPSGLAGSPSPLLEEEGYAGILAISLDAPHPSWINWSSAVSALTTYYHPFDTIKVLG